MQVSVDQLVRERRLLGVLLAPIPDILGRDLGLSAVVQLGELRVYAAEAVKLDARLRGRPIAVLAEKGKRPARRRGLVVGAG